MQRSAYDLKAFYNTKVGRVIRRVLQERIRGFWPDAHGLRVMGCGYATPYLRSFSEEAERVFALMPAGQGAHDWPHDAKNLVCVAEEAELPIENSSVDRILLIHDLEFSELIRPSMEELWRVLKPNGRLLIVVPNRGGWWTRADWSPFGKGTPYSATQIYHHLHDNMFVHERTEEALFMPPIKFSPLLKSARAIENFCKSYCPVMGGVHMVEASKQLYAAPIDKGKRSRVTIRGRNLIPRPATQAFKS